MKISKSFFTKSFLFLLTFSVYTPKFGVLDRMSIQYFLLSITVFITIALIPFIFKEFKLKKLFYNPFVLCFGFYFIFSILSITKSINIIESIVRINQLITFVLLLLIIVFLVIQRLIKINHILFIFLFTLVVDLFFSLKTYTELVFNGINYGYEYNQLIVGLQGNRNILATIIAFRIPLIILLATRVRNKYLNIFIFIISMLSFFNIFLLSSRATFLSIIICLIFIIVFSIVRNYKFGFKQIRKYYITLLYILPCALAYLLSTQMIDTKDRGNVSSRVSTIVSTDDESKNTRLRYYSQSISHIKENLFLGAGIGNWKIVSIKYDKDYIRNYIIPYNAHNDILEAAAETGIFGGIFFLLFYIYMVVYLLKHFKYRFNNSHYYSAILLSLSFLIYFIDLNLNFPSSRPVNIFMILMYLALLTNFNMILNEKN